MVDLHSHILPGIDDGAKDMDDTLQMARVAVEDGIDTIVATPHAYWDGGVNSGPIIQSGVREIKQALADADVPLTVIAGAEVPMERRLVSKLREDPAWTYAGDGVYLLLEPPWGPLPDYCLKLVEDLIAEGITPLIAHPERSPDFQSSLSMLDKMLAEGALVQVTANSILGRHGGKARDVALRLLHSGRVHIVASDAHNARNRAPVLGEARQAVVELLNESVAERLFVDNPRKVVDGLPLDAVLDEERPNQAPSGRALGNLFSKLRGKK